MNMKRIILGTLLLTVLGCSEDIKILEERIKAQAERNNTEISVADIKKTAYEIPLRLVGSEMCIRDSLQTAPLALVRVVY